MSTGRVLLLMLGCLVAGGAAYSLLSSESGGQTPTLAADSERLDRIERQLERLVGVVAAQQEQQALLRTEAPSAAAAAGAPGASTRRPAPGLATAGVAPAVQGSEAGMIKTLGLVPDEKLRIQAEKLKKAGDHAGAALRYKALLKRDLSADDRATALLGLGMALKKDGELQKALEVFRTLADSNAEHMQTGATGGLQVAHTLLQLNDARGALAAARRVANSDAIWLIKAQGRWLVVESLLKMGDEAGARTEMESMLKDYEDEPKYGFMVKQVKQRMKQLD